MERYAMPQLLEPGDHGKSNSFTTKIEYRYACPPLMQQHLTYAELPKPGVENRYR